MEVAVEAAQGAAERERPSEEASCGDGAEHRRAQGDQLKKLVKPVEKRRTVDHRSESRGMSLRLSCGLVGKSRGSYAYRSSRDDSELLDLIKEKALERKIWGYRRLAVVDDYTQSCLWIEGGQFDNRASRIQDTGQSGRASRQARENPLGERARVRGNGPGPVELPKRGEAHLYPARQAPAELLRGELRRPLPGRVPGSRTALDSSRGSSGDRGLAMEIQLHPAPSLAALRDPAGVQSGTIKGNRTEPILGLQSAHGLLATQN